MAPFGSSTASREESTFKGTLSNGQRENSVIGDSDRSASVLEGNASQAFVSGANMLQGSSTSSADSDPSAQSSKLDPKATSQKYTVTSSGELRQVLGTSLGNSLEDCAFRTANLISRLPADSEKLKEFKVRMQEASGKSR